MPLDETKTYPIALVIETGTDATGYQTGRQAYLMVGAVAEVPDSRVYGAPVDPAAAFAECLREVVGGG